MGQVVDMFEYISRKESAELESLECWMRELLDMDSNLFENISFDFDPEHICTQGDASEEHF